MISDTSRIERSLTAKGEECMRSYRVIVTVVLVSVLLLAIVFRMPSVAAIVTNHATAASVLAQSVAPTFLIQFPLMAKSREPNKVVMNSPQRTLEARRDQQFTVTATAADDVETIPGYPVVFNSMFGQVLTPNTHTDRSGIATTIVTIDNTDIHEINAAPYRFTVSATVGGISNTIGLNLMPILCQDIEDKNDGPADDNGSIEINTACIGDFTDDQPDSDNNDDYYILALPQTSAVRITLRNIPRNANYDLQVSKSVGNGEYRILGMSAKRGNSDEVVQLDRVDSGTYFVRVFLRSKAPFSNTYILALTVQ